MADNATTMANADRQKQYEQGLFPHVITGNPQGENLILLAGYPDNELSGWAPLIDLLKHKYQIIAICFPQVWLLHPLLLLLLLVSAAASRCYYSVLAVTPTVSLLLLLPLHRTPGEPSIT